MIPIRRPAKGSPLLIPEQSEADFQRQVIAYAELNHWKIYHTFRSDRSAPGFPDIVAVRERCVWIELKRVGGKLRPEQEEWRDALISAGQSWYCLTPDMWDEIERIFAREAA